MSRLAACALVVCGCQSVLGIHDLNGQGQDARGQSADTSCSNGVSFAVPNVDSCSIPVPTQALVASFNIYLDTKTGTLLGPNPNGPDSVALSSVLVNQPSGPMLRVFSLTKLTLNATTTMHITGEYAVVFVVDGDVTITGLLLANGTGQATADSPSFAGAGARNGAECGGHSGSVALNEGGAGGGGFGYAGGLGGMGIGANDAGMAGGAGGTPDTDTMLEPLVGGCPGGTLAGETSYPGGAIEIVSSHAIVISGVVSVSGGGGYLADSSLRRPGGASGGAILLAAPHVTFMSDSSVTANGGNGAQDGTGLDGSLTSSSPVSGNGHGGAGDQLTGGAGQAGSSNAGGGGGGAGRIVVRSPSFDNPLTAKVSPPVTKL